MLHACTHRTAVIGTGRVPKEKYSFVVILTIGVGLGIPGCLVLLTVVFVFIKKRPWENLTRLVSSGYQNSPSKLH